MHYSILFFIVLFPLPLFAGVIINEIMYDLEGSDSGREWIEVVNTGNESVDISTWRFFENDVNHKFTIIQGDGVLASGEHAIIADNSDNFLIDWPVFQGMLFDSSFSLKNTGEFIALHNADLIEINSVSYISDWGAGGDNNSLQLSPSAWLSAFPTPGETNAKSASPPENNSDTQTPNEESNTESSPQNNTVENNAGSSFPIEPQIFAYAGEDRTVIVGADSVFEGQAYNLENELLEGARYIWNFGNGERREGKNILHHYTYPGEYVVILDVSSSKFSVSDRIIVKALPSDVIISKVESQFIELSNEGSRELNVSWWLLQTKDGYFVVGVL